MRACATTLGVLAVGLLFGGCSRTGDGDVVAMTASPPHAPMFGDVDITFTGDFSRVGQVAAVTVGGIGTLDVRATDGSITVHLQGAPTAGPAEVVVTGDGGTIRNPGAFAYDDAPANAPPSWVAFGASLTQGMQSAGLSRAATVMGYTAQIARAAGVYIGLPLFRDGVLPPLEASQFVSDCDTSPDAGAVGNDLFAAIWDSTTNTLDLRRARLDASLAYRDLGVGGSKLADVIAGPQGMPRFIHHIVELPDGDPTTYTAPVQHTQLERLQMIDADVGLSGDLLANDAIVAVDQGDDLHPEQMTDVATITGYMTTLAQTLGALHGQYFVAKLLDLTLLPNVDTLRAKNLPGFEAKLAQIKATMSAYDDALAAAFAPYPNLHTVDLAAQAQVIANGATIGGVQLDGRKFGGILSLDHMHFTDTGYALLANVFIDAIDQQLGSSIPPVDVAAVLAQDPLSPAALAAAGVHCR